MITGQHYIQMTQTICHLSVTMKHHLSESFVISSQHFFNYDDIVIFCNDDLYLK
jgi:hypothetical protein